MSIGLTLPFMKSTDSVGYLASSKSELEATKYNLMSLVLTDWGERVDQFYMGCNLIEFLFEQDSQETHALITDRIRTQAGTWLPYVSIDSVDIVSVNERMHITIKFSLSGRTDLNDTLEVSVAQNGG